MNNQILKLPIEKLTIGTINKLSSNSVGFCKSHFEQFITTQPGMMDLLNHICQSLTYNDSKSVKNEYISQFSNYKVRISSLPLEQQV